MVSITPVSGKRNERGAPDVRTSVKSFALGLLLLIPASLFADTPRPFRIAVRHADPWAVKAMLEGIAIRNPEMSTLPGFQGLGQAANTAASLIQNGRLVVNPTDNSLWYFPNRNS